MKSWAFPKTAVTRIWRRRTGSWRSGSILTRTLLREPRTLLKVSLNPRSEVRRVAFSFLFSINPVSSSVTAIGNAYAVLSNPEKRQQYDQYGDQAAAAAAPQSANHRRAGHYRSFHRDFEADISPEELFNIFFGGRFPTGRTEACSTWSICQLLQYYCSSTLVYLV